MKGERTRERILDAAMHMTSMEGLNALSIGRLAKSVKLSKSGLFAHFNSKEALQRQVLERATEAFTRAIIRPAIKKERGIARLRAMFDNWLRWANTGGLPGGCIFVGASVELDDKPGPLRDYLVKTQRDWIGILARATAISVEEGHLPPDTSPEQMAFEIYGVMLSFHMYRRLLGDSRARSKAKAAFERMTASH